MCVVQATKDRGPSKAEKISRSKIRKIWKFSNLFDDTNPT